MSEHQAREAMRYDAKKHMRCKTCRAWDNPEGNPLGFCILNPGVAFLIAMPPGRPPAIVNPQAPPMQMAPQLSVQSSPIPKGPEDGCLQWQRRIEELH